MKLHTKKLFQIGLILILGISQIQAMIPLATATRLGMQKPAYSAIRTQTSLKPITASSYTTRPTLRPALRPDQQPFKAISTLHRNYSNWHWHATSHKSAYVQASSVWFGIYSALALFTLFFYEPEKKAEKLYAKDFEQLGIRYIEDLEGDFGSIAPTEIDPIYLKYKSYCDNLDERYGPCIDKKSCCPLYISHINETIGYGCFADCNIEPTDFVGVYSGIVETIKLKNLRAHQPAYAFNYEPILPYSPEATIHITNAQCAGNFTRFVNHSWEPNVEAEIFPHNGKWYTVFVALKPIKKDEQLLIDYGPGYWIGRDIEPEEL